MPRTSGTDGFFDRLRRGGLARSDDRWVGGVAAGVAERFGIDPLLVRGLLLVSLFVTGVGLVLYGIGWALLPERRDGRIHLQQALRGSFDVAMLGAVAIFLVGLSWGGPWSWWDDSGMGWLGTFFWLGAIGLVIYLLVQNSRRRTTPAGVGPVVGTVGGTAGGPVHSAGGPTPGPAPTATGTAATDPAATGSPAGSPAGAATAFRPAPPVEYRADRANVPPPYQLSQPLPAPNPGAPVPPNTPYGPAGYGPAGAPVVTPPAPRQPRERRAGTGVVVGLILLAGAVLLAQDRLGIGVPGPTGDLGFWSAWIGVGTIIIGCALVVSGLRGRTGGGLNFWAVVAVVIALAGTAAWADRGYDGTIVVGPDDLRIGDTTPLTDGTVAITDVERAERGLEIPWGNPTVDLTGLDLDSATTDDPVRVPVEVLAGDTTIIVPDGVAVEAQVSLGAGTAHWRVDGEDLTLSDFGSTNLFSNEEADDAGGAVLRLDVEVAAGDIEITEN